MRKKKPSVLRLTKETQAARSKRVSSGAKFRATAFDNKKRKLMNKEMLKEDRVNKDDREE